LAKNRFDLSICAVIADVGLDSAKALSFIINDLKTKPYIARNLISEDIRKQIVYGTPKFKKVYNLHSGCERIFSRLFDLCMQNPSIRGLRDVSNRCTIAHITVLLVALTAAKIGNKDKIRFIKSFFPNI